MTLSTLETLSASGEDCLLWCITAVPQPILKKHLFQQIIATIWASTRHGMCTTRSYKEAVQLSDDLLFCARAFHCRINLGLPRSAIRHLLFECFPVPPCAQKA